VSAFRKESLVWSGLSGQKRVECGVCWPLLLRKGGRRGRKGGRRGKKWKLLAAGDDWRKQGAALKEREGAGAGAI
jgi:hypothetical protein